MSLHFAILGFLSHQPFSGYDLKKAFDASVQHFWPADQSQIYRTLAQLEERNWVNHEVVAQDDKPDRKVYSVTEEGRAELLNWLRTPLAMENDREPFLIQIFFAGLLSNDELLSLLHHRKQEIAQQYAYLHQVYETGVAQVQEFGAGRAGVLSMVTAENALVIGQAYLGWLDDLIERVENNDFTPKTIRSIP